MDDFTPEQKQEIEKMLDQREQRKKEALSTIGTKSWIGIGVIILAIVTQMLGSSPLILPILAFLAFGLIYSDMKPKL